MLGKRKEENRLNEFRYITYLIGAMEQTAEKDDGQKKRISLEEELIKRNIYPINPCNQEFAKVGMRTADLNKKRDEWIKERNFSEYGKTSRLIWKGKDITDDKGNLIHIPGDLDYVRMSNWITFIFNKGDSPCGSYGESFVGFDYNKPVYLITDIPIEKLKKSLLDAVFGSNGYVFDSENAYLHFIENEYDIHL